MAFNAGAIMGRIGLNAKGWFSSMGRVKSSVSGFKKSAAGMGQSIKRFGRTMAITGLVVSGILGGLTAKAAAFQGELANIGTLGVNDLDAIEKIAKDITEEFGGNLLQNTKAIYQALSAGLPEDSLISVLPAAAKGAAVGVGNLNAAIDVGTSILNSYNREVSDFADIMGEVTTAVKFGKLTINDLGVSVGRASGLMRSAGISSKEYLASIAGLTTTGLKASEAVSSLKQAVSNIIRPSERAKDMADNLGIKFDAAALKAKGLIGFLDGVAEAIKRQMTPAQQRRDAIEKEIAALEKSIVSNSSIRRQIRELKKEYEELSTGGHLKRRDDLAKEIAKMEEHGVSTLKDRQALDTLKREYESLSTEGVAARLRDIGVEVQALEGLRGKNSDVKGQIKDLQSEYNDLSEKQIKRRLKEIEKESEQTRKQIEQKAKQKESFVDEQITLAKLRKEREFLTGEQQSAIATMGELFESTESVNTALELTGKSGEIAKDAMVAMDSGAAGLEESFTKFAEENEKLDWEKFLGQIQVLAVDLGESLLPVMSDLLDTAKPWVEKLSEWIEKNPELTKQIGVAAVAIGAFAVVAGTLLAAVGTLTIGIAALAGTGGFLALTGSILAVVGAGGAGILFGTWVNKMIDIELPLLAKAFDLQSDILVGILNPLNAVIGLMPKIESILSRLSPRSAALRLRGFMGLDSTGPDTGGDNSPPGSITADGPPGSVPGSTTPAGAAVGATGNRTINMTNVMQPGEDIDAFSRKVVARIDEMQRRGQLGAGARLAFAGS